MNPEMRGVAYFLFIVFSIAGIQQSASTEQDKNNFDQSSLRSMLLNQPDFRAELEYEEQGRPRMVDQVKTVMKKGKMYRFEVPEENSLDGPLVLLAYPDKGIRIMSPKEKIWTDKFNLDQAAFTTLSGVELYYLTKIVRHKDSSFQYIGTEEFNGYSCLKIEITNKAFLNPEEASFETIYLINGPLYLYVSTEMKNLIIGLKGTDSESKKEGFFYALKNISLDASKIPKELFRVPSDFRKMKTE
jgi:hypothetical protein